MTHDDTPTQEDPLAAASLSALAALPPGKSLDPQDIAKAIAAGRAQADDPPDLGGATWAAFASKPSIWAARAASRCCAKASRSIRVGRSRA